MRQKEKKEQELEEKLCPGYMGHALFLIWPVVASENTAFIWDFLSFYGSKELSQTRKRSMAWNDVTNCAIPRLLKVILLLGRVLKKRAIFDL